MAQRRAPFTVSTGSAAEGDAVTPGIEVRGNGVERERDPSLAGIDGYGVHEVAGEQHYITGIGRRADPLVRVVGAGRDAGVVVLERKVRAARRFQENRTRIRVRARE